MEPRHDDVPSQPAQPRPAREEKKRRFKLVRLEERIAPSSPLQPSQGNCNTSRACGDKT
jgi:hypothetical protein